MFLLLLLFLNFKSRGLPMEITVVPSRPPSFWHQNLKAHSTFELKANYVFHTKES